MNVCGKSTSGFFHVRVCDERVYSVYCYISKSVTIVIEEKDANYRDAWGASRL